MTIEIESQILMPSAKTGVRMVRYFPYLSLYTVKTKTLGFRSRDGIPAGITLRTTRKEHLWKSFEFDKSICGFAAA